MDKSGSVNESASLLRVGMILIIAVALIRLLGVILTPLELGSDEAQYWRWGDTLEWGYWSKPPLIGWAIHFSTALFGDAEWAVRFFAPLSHGFGAAMVLLLGRAMFDARTGLMAGLSYLFMPGVVLSSSVMSTDGLLLPIWAGGLLMFWRLRSGQGSWLSAIGLGAAIGLGLLAKYAMIYFLIGVTFAVIFDAPSRRALASLKGAAAGVIGALIFLPHMLWNAANSFKTVSHTADNANWGGDLINIENFFKFLSDQMGVFGPVAFLALLGGLIAYRKGAGAWIKEPRERWLLGFILPPLIIILVQAVISRAHANWAATAYPAACVLVSAWLLAHQSNRWIWWAMAVFVAAAVMPEIPAAWWVQIPVGMIVATPIILLSGKFVPSDQPQWAWWVIAALIFLASLSIPGVALYFRIGFGVFLGGGIVLLGLAFRHRMSGLLWTGIGLQVAISIMFSIVAMSPPSVSEQLGIANAFKRTRGWDQSTTELADKARELGATALVVDEREVYHAIDYYGREDFPTPIRTWRLGAAAKSYAEEFTLQPGEDGRVLVASVRDVYREKMRADFATFESAGTISIPIGGGRERTFELFIASGFDPVPRDTGANESGTP